MLRVIYRWAILASVAHTGCYRPTADACSYTCNEGLCPEGLTCNGEGFCANTATQSCRAADAHVATCVGATFSTPSAVAILNAAADEYFLRLAADELTAYFSRISATPTAMIATRSSATSPFSPPTALTIMGNAGLDVNSPSVTADGRTLYFTSVRAGGSGMTDIWQATRTSTTADFGAIANVSNVNSTAEEADVYAVPDGSAIYFSSDRNGGFYSIFRAERQGSSFAAPVEVLAVPSAFVNRVVVLPDELTIFYQAGNEIHETTRATTDDTFAEGTPHASLSSPNADQPTWISSDGCRLYFMTNRAGTAGLDFYVAVREPR